MPNDEWKRWLDQVTPLMLPAERAEARSTAPSERVQFREDFWRARNPDPSSVDNPVRAEFERRIQTAEKRLHINGKSGWNDCGRTYIVLGNPTWMRSNRGKQHFSAQDPTSAFSSEEQEATEIWIYRDHPRLPPSPEGYAFRFNPACEAVASPSADRLLQRAVASYVTRER